MNVQLRPVLQLLVYFFQRLHIILIELYFLPQSIRRVSPLNCLHTEYHLPLTIQHSRISGISKRTELPNTDASEVHFVGAEGSVFGLGFKRTLALSTNDLPNYVVLYHFINKTFYHD